MAQEPARPPPRRPDETTSDRLDSWKDVAAYLQRDVSTVQRWKNGRPCPCIATCTRNKARCTPSDRSSTRGGEAAADGCLSRKTANQAKYRRRQRPANRGTRGPEILALAATSQRPWWAHWRLILIGMVALGMVLTIVSVPTFHRASDEQSVDSTRIGDPVRAAAGVPTIDGREHRESISEAYDLLLRARYLSVRTTDADNQSAIALLQRSIELEPSFAAAHAELASAYVTRLAYVTPDVTRELEEKAFAAAQRALSLDPNVPEAYRLAGTFCGPARSGSHTTVRSMNSGGRWP